MTVNLNLASLSDHLTKISASPESFSFFYKKLIGLRFPIDVAEILELRSLFNQTLDAMEEIPESRDFQHFSDARQAEIDALKIEKKQHGQRLLKLLALIREFHFAHSLQSRDTENHLRKALSDNNKARIRSIHYGQITFIVALISAFIWVAFNPGWVIQIFTVGLAYLFGDYFYSLSILKRDSVELDRQLQELLKRRVKTLNWQVLTRNISLILGYAKISGVQAFLIDKESEQEERHDQPRG
jgi:low affinity Fe/Cu permease